MNLEITVKELEAKIGKKEDFTLLDVRTDREHNFAHLKNSVHIPLDKLDSAPSLLDKEKEILIYCHHGRRSLTAAHILLELGFQNVKSVSGGIHEWSVAVDPSVPTY